MSRHTQFTREYRAESANVRKKERDNRSDHEQLKRLDDMFGKGEGAVKERKRLQKRIGNDNLKKGIKG